MFRQAAEKATVIVVTHDQARAEQYADRIYRIEDGSVSHTTERKTNEKSVESSLLKKNIPPKKGHLTPGQIMRFSQISIKKLKGRFVTISLVLAFFLAGFFLLCSARGGVKEEMNSLNTLYYEADRMSISYRWDLKTWENIAPSNGKPMLQSDMDSLNQAFQFADIVPVNPEWSSALLSNDSLRFIRMDSFFKERIKAGELEGRFPEKPYEIIIGQDVADQHYDGNGIGKTFILENDDTIEYTIVGINHYKTVDGKYYTYVPYESLESFEYTRYGARISLFSSFPEPDAEFYMWGEDASGDLIQISPADSLHYGRLPDKEGEIAVSLDIAARLYQAEYSEAFSFDGDRISQNDPAMLQALERLMSLPLVIGTEIAREVRITGFLSGVREKIAVTAEEWHVLTKVYFGSVDAYVKDLSQLTAIKDHTLNETYHLYSVYEQRFVKAIGFQGMIDIILLITGAFSLIMIILLVHSYAKVMIGERVYEIGILKTLGASRGDLYVLLSCDLLFLGISTAIASLLFYAIGALFCMIIPQLQLSPITSMLPFFAAALLGMPILCALLSVGKIKRYATSLPVDDLRARI